MMLRLSLSGKRHATIVCAYGPQWPTLMRIKTITKTCLYNFDPIKPHFYIVKLGFTGVYIIFLISTLDEAVLTSTHNLCFEQKYEKKIRVFYLKNFICLEVKFSIYLNRCVFVMTSSVVIWILWFLQTLGRQTHPPRGLQCQSRHRLPNLGWSDWNWRSRKVQQQWPPLLKEVAEHELLITNTVLRLPTGS